MRDTVNISGLVTVELHDDDGRLVWQETVHNIITDAGDLYLAQKAIVGISPANASACLLYTSPSPRDS